MNFNLEESIMLLERTPAVLDEYLRDLPESWTTTNEGGETWSPFDVVGHLIHGEKTDWIPRTRLILAGGQTPFTPFDRFAQQKSSAGKTMNQLLDEFTGLRTENITELKQFNLTAEQLTWQGIHPEFGPVSLEQLLATWVVHDQGHIYQISRVMARNLSEAAGPWKAYLRVLND